MSAKKILLGLLDAIVKVAFVVVVVMLISKYAKVAYSYGYHIFNQQAVSSGTGRTVTFTVGKGDSVGTIADNLASVGLITDKNLFKLQERFSENHGKEQPGTYELSTSMTTEEILDVISGDKETETEGESSDDTAEESSGG
ncbi:MAG: endolytic transglycosylase MltG [Butyrivibrio sp.]|nr:endolytic transglycosylase MltG [Butyrivibrio sp.]